MTRKQLARMARGELLTALVAAERILLASPLFSDARKRASTTRAAVLAEIRRRDDALHARLFAKHGRK